MASQARGGATASPDNPFLGKSYATGLNDLVARFAERDALVFESRRWSFRDAKREIDSVSARLASLGLRQGEKISLWLPNRPEFVWFWLGAVQAGIVPVVLNNRMKLDEAAYQIDQSDSVAIVVPGDGAFRDFLADVGTLRNEGRLPKLQHVVVLDHAAKLPTCAVDWSDPAEGDLPMPELVTDPAAPGFIVYSSGTTALPKGAVLNQTGLRKAWDHGERFGQTMDDRFLMVVPLFGILANVNGVLTAWSRGSCVVLEAQFEAKSIIETIERERCTVAYLFPVMIERILEHPAYRPDRTASLRTGILVGTDTAAMKRVAEDLRMPGYFTSYGMTETSSACTRCYSTDPVEIRQNTHGRPLPDIEVEIRDVESGAKLAPRAEGEICVRGYNIMIEYYNKPVETAAA
ncbi:MAG: long-chain fatty acid--CoA ligase, partial [Reyranellaceae bacterium]